jgi:hypothetical protein
MIQITNSIGYFFFSHPECFCDFCPSYLDDSLIGWLVFAPQRIGNAGTSSRPSSNRRFLLIVRIMLRRVAVRIGIGRRSTTAIGIVAGGCWLLLLLILPLWIASSTIVVLLWTLWSSSRRRFFFHLRQFPRCLKGVALLIFMIVPRRGMGMTISIRDNRSMGRGVGSMGVLSTILILILMDRNQIGIVPRRRLGLCCGSVAKAAAGRRLLVARCLVGISWRRLFHRWSWLLWWSILIGIADGKAGWSRRVDRVSSCMRCRRWILLRLRLRMLLLMKRLLKWLPRVLGR